MISSLFFTPRISIEISRNRNMQITAPSVLNSSSVTSVRPRKASSFAEKSNLGSSSEAVTVCSFVKWIDCLIHMMLNIRMPHNKKMGNIIYCFDKPFAERK